jgi:hypothetical protein
MMGAQNLQGYLDFKARDLTGVPVAISLILSVVFSRLEVSVSVKD